MKICFPYHFSFIFLSGWKTKYWEMFSRPFPSDRKSNFPHSGKKRVVILKNSDINRNQFKIFRHPDSEAMETSLAEAQFVDDSRRICREKKTRKMERRNRCFSSILLFDVIGERFSCSHAYFIVNEFVIFLAMQNANPNIHQSSEAQNRCVLNQSISHSVKKFELKKKKQRQSRPHFDESWTSFHFSLFW